MMQIGHSSYDSDNAKRQKHKRHYHTISHECHDAQQVPPGHSGNGNPPSSHNGSSISRDLVVSSIYT